MFIRRQIRNTVFPAVLLGERFIGRGGQLGTPDCFDFRSYRLPPPWSITLYFMGITAIESESMVYLLGWLEFEPNRPVIDLFIFSSLENDLNRCVSFKCRDSFDRLE